MAGEVQKFPGWMHFVAKLPMRCSGAKRTPLSIRHSMIA